MLQGRITELAIFPVKSLAGIRVAEIVATPLGLAGDREWMLVNAQGRFVTQRLLPQLALIQPELRDGQLSLSAPGMAPVFIPTLTPDAPSLEVLVWKDSCRAQIAPTAINQWLTQAAKSAAPLQLVRLAPGFRRTANTERFGSGSHTQFADAAPFLVAHQASLDALNARLIAAGEVPVDMRRFRANLIVESEAPAFSEHGWSQLTLGEGLSLGLKDHCKRCSMITVDPDRGEFSANTAPFTQLTQLNAMPDNPKAPAFGVNAVLNTGAGVRLRLGDLVAIA